MCSLVPPAARTVCQRHIPAHVLRARHPQILGRLRRVPVTNLSRRASPPHVRAVLAPRQLPRKAPAERGSDTQGGELTSVWSRIVTSPEGEIPTHALAGVEKHHQTSARRSKPGRDIRGKISCAASTRSCYTQPIPLRLPAPAPPCAQSVSASVPVRNVAPSVPPLCVPKSLCRAGC
jgi:hypothetical protein